MKLRLMQIQMLLVLRRRNHQASQKKLRKVLVNSKVSMIVRIANGSKIGKAKSLGRKTKTKSLRKESTLRNIFRLRRRSKRVLLMEGSSKVISESTLTTGTELLSPYKALR
jgi:hypothetical protein